MYSVVNATAASQEQKTKTIESDPREYWEARLKKNFGLDSVGLIGLGKHYNEWLYKIRANVFLRRMKAMDVDFSRLDVLDIGSGTGFYVGRWKDLGVKRIVGADIASVAVENLRRKYPGDEFHQLDIGDDIQAIENHRFDIVSAFDVLFHIVDNERFEKAIRNIYSVLKPGGLFILSDNFLHQETIISATQASRSLHDIESILNDTGFKIVGRVPMFVVMNYPVDSTTRFLKTLWRVMAKVISIHEFFGWVAGATLYPVELICVSSMRESPTTEMMICRKPD